MKGLTAPYRPHDHRTAAEYTYTCELNIYGVSLRVRSRQEEAILHLRSLCTLFVLPDRPRADDGGEWIDATELDIFHRLSEHRIVAFHAAGYKNGKGEGILLPGKTASGKTTIAHTVLSAGRSIIGDDVVLCRRRGDDLELLPFRAHLSLKREGEDRIYDVLEHYPREVFCAACARVLVFPRIAGKGESAIKRLHDRKVIVNRLVENTIWVRDPLIRKRQASILERLCALPAYDLSLGGDHRERPEVALGLLEGV